ncbi:MAG: UDP-N-acetylmuramate dehydrogenase [Treponemataceae bacterium]|nr:UDP-N-acetylmuramate dehydrogenase [Treponemataceae bacterium]
MNNLRNISENINICKGFRGSLKTNELFSGHTTFRTGGAIPLYAEPVDEEDIKTILLFFREKEIPSFILGGGSNIVPEDDGLDFAVISTCRLDGIAVCEKKDDEGTLLLICGAGTPIQKITDFCIEKGYSGFESFAGLPGTAGGAVFMNARCYGASVSDVLESVRYADCSSSDISFVDYTMKKDDWDYKRSPFQNTTDIILSASFRVKKGDGEDIRKKSEEFIEDRRNKGHFRYPSAGSVFKNNRSFGKPSGQIIQDAGLRGFSVGDAQVAPWHGNIIINKGKASSSEIKELSETVAFRVKEMFGFCLENEIIFVNHGSIR